ncbi:MAG: U32 family peptidase, partial [Lachnospiraceae bacterium]|nr:U32 family peptidase [Lachnospiraceae bacterium]
MKTELLAPAGSIEGLKAVIAAGADAVYIGGTKFGARAYADNPDEDDLLDAIDYAHLRDVKVYMTVNTLLKDNEIKELPAYLAPYVERGLDAVLVQDFGVLALLSRTFPDLPLHASTQMTITGPFGASLLKEYGVVRVVPARELSLRELSRIRRESGLEVEAFVHGALCYSYSGMCLFSSMLGGRSGNRGRCAQPCRLPYAIGSGKRKTQGYLLSPKDLCGLDLLPELIDAGVDSLKIEGRMKGPEYAALTAFIYRKYADLYLETGDAGFHVEESDRKKLLEMFNRGGFTDGYFARHNGPEMISKQRPGHAGVRIGTGTAQRGIARISLSQDTAKGDLIELPGGQEIRLKESAAA